jgi:hypothetical protein
VTIADTEETEKFSGTKIPSDKGIKYSVDLHTLGTKMRGRVLLYMMKTAHLLRDDREEIMEPLGSRRHDLRTVRA